MQINPHPRGIAFGFHGAGITRINSRKKAQKAQKKEGRIGHRPTQTDTDFCPADNRWTKIVIASRKETEIRGRKSEVWKGQKSELSRLRKATPCQGGREKTDVGGSEVGERESEGS